MNENDKQAAQAADLQQDKDNERDDASLRYDEYWFAFNDWCARRGIPVEDMHNSDYQSEFERDYYGE
jgi:hypothetical protein